MEMKRLTIFMLLLILLCGCCNTSFETSEYPDNTKAVDALMVDPSYYASNINGTNGVSWNDMYSVKNTSLSMDIYSMVCDSERVFRTKAEGITTNDLAGIPSLLLGDSLTDLKRIISDEDPVWLRKACTAYQFVFHPERLPLVTAEYDTGNHFVEIPTWEEEDAFFYHTYSGTIDNCRYYLFLGFRSDYGIANIELWPLNPGDLIGREEYNIINWYSTEYGGKTLADGKELRDELNKHINQTKRDEKSLKEIACGVLLPEIHIHVSIDDLTLSRYRGAYDQVYFFSEEIGKTDEYERAIVDGYKVYFNSAHEEYGMPTWLDTYETLSDIKTGNYGYYMIHDSGIISCSLQLSYRFSEDAISTKVLSFDHLKLKFSCSIEEQLNVSMAGCSPLTCNQAVLMYYATIPDDKSEEGGMEYIPVWRYQILIDGWKPYAEVIQNAVSGEIIYIEYE